MEVHRTALALPELPGVKFNAVDVLADPEVRDGITINLPI